MRVYQDGNNFYDDEAGGLVYMATTTIRGDMDVAGAIMAKGEFERWAMGQGIKIVWVGPTSEMTFKKAKRLIASMGYGLTLTPKNEHGEYGVNHPDRNGRYREEYKYRTNNLVDAVDTAEMIAGRLAKIDKQ